MDHLRTSRDKSHFQSLQGQGAGAWLSAVPSISAFALSSKEFNLATMIRLGCKIPQSTGRCNYGRDLDQEGYHLVTCKSGGGSIQTHNAIVHVWSKCLTELNFQHSKEPTHRYLDNDNRPDIVVINPQTGHDTELDISLAHPWCTDFLILAASTAGIATSRREERKYVKYNQELIPRGIKPSFVPLVLEHSGRGGIQASNYLKKLAETSRDDEGKKNKTHFKTKWRSLISIQLQRYFTKVIADKSHSIHRMNNTVANY